MIPLSVVCQGRYENFTTVEINQSRTSTLNLFDYFVSKVGRQPKVDENIKFIITSGTTLIGTLTDYDLSTTNSALYIRKTDFLNSNTITIDNYGIVTGRGGDGRSRVTSDISPLGGRAYIVPDVGLIAGGDSIVNESTIPLVVNNYGTVCGGGGGGGAIGQGSYSTAAIYTEFKPTDWFVNLTHGPGGGGAPYGKGGIEGYRAEDFMSGNYLDVMEAQARTVKTISLVKSTPAMLYVDLGDPTLDIYDAYDTDSTRYRAPLGYDASNYLPFALTLRWRLKSPTGSAHYLKYKSIIEGPDKERVNFYKTIASRTTGSRLNVTSHSLYVYTPPYYNGQDASATVSGKPGFCYTEHNTNRTHDIDGFVAYTGGQGGDLGRRGSRATLLDDTKMYSYKSATDPTKGYNVRTMSSVKNDLGLNVTSLYNIFDRLDTDPGDPGYITKGNVTINNQLNGKSLGKMDIFNVKDLLSKFGSITALKYIDVIADESTTSYIPGNVKHVTLIDKISNASPVILSTFSTISHSTIESKLDAVSISRTSQLPSGSSYLVITEYGILNSVSVTSSTLTISNINQRAKSTKANPGAGIVPLVIVCASSSTITKIQNYITSLDLNINEWNGRPDRTVF